MKSDNFLLERVRAEIERYNMFAPAGKVVVAVSGGPDSVALLHILKSLSGEYDLTLLAAHVNHQLRPEADAEEETVRKLCDGWRIPLRTERIDVKSLAAATGKTIEEAGRDSRYDFFHRLRQECEADYIATAHHRHDQAETVLLHLLRGSGIKGLRGIMPVSGPVVRPLLRIDKADLIEYLHSMGVGFCEDKSNSSCEFKRNRIRHELIPYLQSAFNPAIVDKLVDLAEIARMENQYVEEKTWEAWPQLVYNEGPDLLLLVDGLLKLPPALQNRVILQALFVMGGEQGWSKAVVETILRLCSQPGSSKFLTLPGGLMIKKSYHSVRFTYNSAKSEPFCYNVNIPGKIIIKETGAGYDFRVMAKIPPSLNDSGVWVLDYDKLTFPLYLRSRRAGDVFVPPGFRGSKKLKKLFIDSKIAYDLRDTIPILASAERIYALPGWQISSFAAITESTVRFLVIEKL